MGKMKGKNGILLFVEFLKGLLEDKKDEEFQNHKEEMGIENEKERTSSMLDCKHNVLQKPIHEILEVDFKGFPQKKDTNKRPSEIRNRRKTRKRTVNKISYFLTNSLNKSL